MLPLHPASAQGSIILGTAAGGITKQVAAGDEFQAALRVGAESLGIAEGQIDIRLAAIDLEIDDDAIVIARANLVTVPTPTRVPRCSRE